MPKFSIIIPVYNVEPYLRECLDSVLAQTFTDWETICVDDGSTDNSGAILDEYAAKDSRFKVIHQPNAGVSAARNAALDVVTGEWLTFVDGDDSISSDCLSAMLKRVDDTAIPLVIGQVRKVWDDGKLEVVGPNVDGEFSAEDLYIKFNSLCCWSCGKLFKRSDFSKIRYPNGIAYSEDRYFLHEILYKYPKVAFVGHPLYHYKIHDKSAYHSPWTVKRLQAMKAFEKQFEYFEKYGFRRAELYTAGWYFWTFTNGLENLIRIFPNEHTQILDVSARLDFYFKKYFSDLVCCSKKERWGLFEDFAAIYERVVSVLHPERKRLLRVMRPLLVLRFNGVKYFVMLVARRLLRRRLFKEQMK